MDTTETQTHRWVYEDGVYTLPLDERTRLEIGVSRDIQSQSCGWWFVAYERQKPGSNEAHYREISYYDEITKEVKTQVFVTNSRKRKCINKKPEFITGAKDFLKFPRLSGRARTLAHIILNAIE